MGQLTVKYGANTILSATEDGAWRLTASGKYFSGDITITADSLSSLTVSYAGTDIISAAPANGSWVLPTAGRFVGEDFELTIVAVAQRLDVLGNILSLPVGTKSMATANAGSYGVFFKGLVGNNLTNTTNAVYAYDAALSLVLNTANSPAQSYMAGASFRDWAVFAGGHNASKAMRYLSGTLTIGTGTNLSYGRSRLAGSANDQYVLLGGGYGSSTSAPVLNVEAYNTNLTHSFAALLPKGVYDLAAGTVGPYICFAGGYRYNVGKSPSVTAYDDSLVQSIPEAMSAARDRFHAANAGEYLILGSDAYDENLVRHSISAYVPLTSGAVTIGKFAVFAGGTTEDSENIAVVDDQLTVTTIGTLSVKRSDCGGVRAGNFALFGGGARNVGLDQAVTDVDVLELVER